MSVYESIKQGLIKATAYQSFKTNEKKTCLNIKPLDTFNNDGIKRLRQITELSQVIFTFSFEVSPKPLEAWENGRNKPEGTSRHLLEIVRDYSCFLIVFKSRLKNDNLFIRIF
jgi:putative transcriptional regulator